MSDEEKPEPAHSVVTKHRHAEKFGNDTMRAAASVSVVTKCSGGDTFGNDTIGFIRVRKRKLKGGHPQWRTLASASMSFDLVKAVRVDGKPRHKFILGLGSQKHGATGRMAANFLLLAIGRMKRHGLTEAQRHTLLAELIRKGARRPTIAECEGWNQHKSWTPYVNELVAWLRGAPCSEQ